ncbi:hypothetical protein [Flammeovirga sp. SubArs3]|uniref:hypothetical protein n=1 Tax=Flammeovirga sp. SubArs3 TaxID=2995316 RepID=UPI00248C638C|nr:hypothetical protein [Flammeovirga sp. SubArs3]
MKKLYILLFCIAATFYQCTNPLEGVDITVNSSTSTHFGMIEISDTTQQDLSQEQISVEIIGEGAEYLYNEAGDKNFTPSNGMLSFVVDPDYTFAAPLEFTVMVRGDNYIEQQIPVTLTESDTLSYTRIELDRLDNVTQGEEVDEDNFDLSSGRFSSTATFSTQRTYWNNSSLSAEVSIPASSGFTDFYGNNIDASGLRMGLGAFDYESYSWNGYSYRMYIPALIRNTQGNLQNDRGIYMCQFLYFYMYAYTSSYQRVYQTSSSFTVRTDINPNTVNQLTGNRIQAGDQIFVYRMSNNNNYYDWYVRETEEAATVQEDGDGSLYISFETKNASYFWIGYDMQVCRSYQAQTTPKTYTSSYSNYTYVYYPWVRNEDFGSIKFSIDKTYNDAVLAGVRVLITFPDGTKQRVYDYYGMRLYDGLNIRPWYSLGNSSMTVEIYDRFDASKVYYTSNAFDLCNGDVTLNVDEILSKLPDYKTVTIDYTGRCGDTVIRPTVPLYVEYDVSNSYYWWSRYQYYYVRNGKVTLYYMEIGKTYKFHTVYNGKWYSEDVTITSELMKDDDYEIPQRLCDLL